MIRKATIGDVESIFTLLQDYGRSGELLPRPLSELYDHLRDFSVFVDDADETVLGCCALQICWKDLAEIRSLAVHPEHVGQNIGSRLSETVLAEAGALSMQKVFTLTYRPEFFGQFGFTEIDRSELPLKIWGECLSCVKFPDCDETAMMKEIG
ncbi:MAG: N-acetyltransferase [Desulfobacterales bacterium]